jgi:hypothetical protein
VTGGEFMRTPEGALRFEAADYRRRTEGAALLIPVRFVHGLGFDEPRVTEKVWRRRRTWLPPSTWREVTAAPTVVQGSWVAAAWIDYVLDVPASTDGVLTYREVPYRPWSDPEVRR